jgi:hypothetical protein
VVHRSMDSERFDIVNDPHVEWLRYRIELGPTLKVTDPTPHTYEADGFSVQLESGRLTASLKEHHASIESARERVEPFLRSWERDSDLKYGVLALRFIREDAQVIDRDPPPPGSPRTYSVQAHAGGIALAGAAAEIAFGMREYPPPPTTFRTTPDVETLWYHYESHMAGKERLSDMGYYCLTVIERLSGGREGAASIFAIDAKVLNRLGKLTSTRGDMRTARKSISQPQPFQPQEETWIKDVVRAMVRRVGEAAVGTPLKKLSMADFPPLR